MIWNSVPCIQTILTNTGDEKRTSQVEITDQAEEDEQRGIRPTLEMGSN